MRKHIVTTAILFCTFLSALSQPATTHFFVELAAGASVSVGKFADKTYSSDFFKEDPSGLAKTGLGVSVTGGYRITKQVSILLLLGSSQNMQDEKAYENYLKQKYGNSITTSVTTNNWKVKKIMTGALLTLPILKQGKLFLQPKLLAGFCKIKIPDYRYIGFDQNGNLLPDNLGRSEEDPDGGFCYQAGAALKYALSKKIYLLLDANYFFSSPVLKYNYNPNFPNPGPATAEAKRNYNVSSVNTFLGAGLNF
jgi:Outer membrane protein beta-barrel domain